MTKRVEQRRWLHLLRSAAHLAIAAMWFIVLAAYLPNLLELSLFEANIGTKIPDSSVGLAPDPIPNAAVIVAAIGGLLIIFLLFIVIKKVYVPATDKVVERMTETAQKKVLMTIQKSQPNMPNRKRKQVSRYAIEAAYFVLIAVPLLVIFVGQPIQTEAIRILAEFTLACLGLFSAVLILLYYQQTVSKYP
jgi:hypothetical protein